MSLSVNNLLVSCKWNRKPKWNYSKIFIRVGIVVCYWVGQKAIACACFLSSSTSTSKCSSWSWCTIGVGSSVCMYGIHGCHDDKIISKSSSALDGHATRRFPWSVDYDDQDAVFIFFASFTAMRVPRRSAWTCDQLPFWMRGGPRRQFRGPAPRF